MKFIRNLAIVPGPFIYIQRYSKNRCYDGHENLMLAFYNSSIDKSTLIRFSLGMDLLDIIKLHSDTKNVVDIIICITL